MAITKNISLNGVNPSRIYGHRNSNLQLIEKYFKSKIIGRGDTIQIEGEEQEARDLDALFTALLKLVNSGNHLTPDGVTLVIDMLRHGSGSLPDPVVPVIITRPRRASARFLIELGRNNSSNPGILVLTARIAIPVVPR